MDEIKAYKVLKLPSLPIKNAILFLLEGNEVVPYVTDVNGTPIPFKDESKTGVGTIVSTDGTITVAGTAEDRDITLSTPIQDLINGALQSGDSVSQLLNDIGYITLADVPLFDPSDFDLEQFNNSSIDPFAKMSDIPLGVDSVFGRVGTVNAETGDYNTDQVTETTDKKYVTQSEKDRINQIDSDLDLKVDKVIGKQLSDENYTLAEKIKLGLLSDIPPTLKQVTEQGNQTDDVIEVEGVKFNSLRNSELYDSTILGTTGSEPRGIAIDNLGNIYTANYYSHNVSKITPDGTSTILGTTGNYPYAITIDNSGNVYTANHYSDNVSKITPDGVSTVLGTTGSNPGSILIDNLGNIYTANFSSDNVSKITPDGTSTILGTTGTIPYAITIDNSGNIYTANSDSNNVSKITPDGTSTILGNTGNYPEGIAIDNLGNVYTANSDSNNVSKITPDGVSTILGTTGNYPNAITIDSLGNIYTANSNSHNVTKITPDGTSTILGTTGSNPNDILIDNLGNIYTANIYADSVSKITIPKEQHLGLDDNGNIVLKEVESPTKVNDATPTEKGIIKLAGDLGGTADAPTTPTALHKTGDETFTGIKRLINNNSQAGSLLITNTNTATRNALIATTESTEYPAVRFKAARVGTIAQQIDIEQASTAFPVTGLNIIDITPNDIGRGGSKMIVLENKKTSVGIDRNGTPITIIKNSLEVGKWDDDGNIIAESVSYDNTASGLSATTLNSAVDELNIEKTDKGGYTGTSQDLKTLVDGALTGFKGSISIADTPTEDGYYPPVEAGTYPNAGGLVYDPEGVDKGYKVTFIKSGAEWVKDRVEVTYDGKVTAWEAGSFANGTQRSHLGKLWESNAAVIATDVPGTSAKWVEVIGVDDEQFFITRGNPFYLEGFITYLGTFAASPTYLSTDYLKLNKKQDLKIRGFATSTNSLAAFYDKDKVFISHISGNSIQNEELTVSKNDLPTNAVYVRSNCNKDTLYPYTSANNIEDRIKEVKSFAASVGRPILKIDGFLGEAIKDISSLNTDISEEYYISLFRKNTTLTLYINRVSDNVLVSSIYNKPLISGLSTYEIPQNGGSGISFKVVINTDEAPLITIYYTALQNLINPNYLNTKFIKGSSAPQGITDLPKSISPSDAVRKDELLVTSLDYTSAKNLFNKNDILENTVVTTGVGGRGTNTVGGFKSTNYIKIKPDTYYTISGFGNFHYSILAAFYDIDKISSRDNVVIMGGTDTMTTFKTGLDDEYIIFTVITAHSSDNTNIDEIQLEEGEFPTEYEDYIRLISTINDVPLYQNQNNGGASLPTKDTKWLVFGDSITEPLVGWTKYIGQLTGASKLWNRAVSGAAYKDRDGTTTTQLGDDGITYYTQKASEQIKCAEVAVDIENPDVVIVALGTNDGTSRIGDYLTAMGKSTLGELDRTYLYEALRYIFWQLRINYPNAKFYACTPIQRASNTNEELKSLDEAIVKMAMEYNFILIDARHNSGIVRDFEVLGGEGLYLRDGLHPYQTEPFGGHKLIAECVCSKVLSTYLKV